MFGLSSNTAWKRSSLSRRACSAAFDRDAVLVADEVRRLLDPESAARFRDDREFARRGAALRIGQPRGVALHDFGARLGGDEPEARGAFQLFRRVAADGEDGGVAIGELAAAIRDVVALRDRLDERAIMFLALAERAFGALQAGDVDEGVQRVGNARDVHEPVVHQQLERAAVAVFQGHLDVAQPAFGREAAEMIFAHGFGGPNSGIHHLSADALRALVTELARHGCVHVRDHPAGERHQHHRHRAVVEEAAEFFFAFAQRDLREAVLGDVLDDALHVDDTALGVELGLALVMDVADFAIGAPNAVVHRKLPPLGERRIHLAPHGGQIIRVEH